ncbi:MAG: hypothetical protein GY820_06480 [Gammaproteobacteria bacterium]|nr:hypothetical protein [Gammaproteobacteria bacterium]
MYFRCHLDHPYLIPGHDNTTRCRSFTPLLDASTITTELVMRTVCPKAKEA